MVTAGDPPWPQRFDNIGNFIGAYLGIFIAMDAF